MRVMHFFPLMSLMFLPNFRWAENAPLLTQGSRIWTNCYQTDTSVVNLISEKQSLYILWLQWAKSAWEYQCTGKEPKLCSFVVGGFVFGLFVHFVFVFVFVLMDALTILQKIGELWIQKNTMPGSCNLSSDFNFSLNQLFMWSHNDGVGDKSRM